MKQKQTFEKGYFERKMSIIKIKLKMNVGSFIYSTQFIFHIVFYIYLILNTLHKIGLCTFISNLMIDQLKLQSAVQWKRVILSHKLTYFQAFSLKCIEIKNSSQNCSKFLPMNPVTRAYIRLCTSTSIHTYVHLLLCHK